MANSEVTTILNFLREIGLRFQESPGANGFTPGIDIKDGVMLIDTTVAIASNILHEAGHLAIVPEEFRVYFQSNVAGGQCAALDEAARIGAEPDSPMLRAVMQTSDTEATAWAWAAGKHLGIPEEIIILDEEYSRGGEAIRLMLKVGMYMGIHGLSHAGFCAINKRSSDFRGIALYPALERWTQPAGLSTS
jgi:hypothetical protein